MFTETFPVRFDECGPNKQSTMRTVASMIQECACNHAQGIWGRAQSMPADMNKANLAWVCTRLHIDVLQYPLWGDQVEVRTWFEAQGRIAARRDWEMSDVTDGSSEKVIARATSSWIAFNLEKRKLARIPQSVLDEFQTQALPDTLVMGDAYEVEKLPDVRGMPGVTLPESHSVRRTDLDMNNHVNNVVYTEWLLESVPDAFWEKYDLREIILEFRNECHDGDNVDAICCRECGEEGVLNCEEKPGQATLVHMLLKRGFGMSPKEAEVVRARSVWRVKK
jgi:fatty acyl-ACP thioesterase A